eukprot:COSAG02_NODE_26256_length_637_cov_0.877323_1_plen_65_part_10
MKAEFSVAHAVTPLRWRSVVTLLWVLQNDIKYLSDPTFVGLTSRFFLSIFFVSEDSFLLALFLMP